MTESVSEAPAPDTLNDEEFHSQTISEGGASRRLSDSVVPDRGYMVGGSPTLKGEKFPEQPVAIDKFSVDHVRHHAREIRDAFGGNTNAHQGSWLENGNTVLDASDNFPTVRSAITSAKLRGERGVYDVRRGRTLNVKAFTDPYNAPLKKDSTFKPSGSPTAP